MKDFKFKPEDFKEIVNFGWQTSIASKANALLQAHLATLPKVYFNDADGMNENNTVNFQMRRARPKDTHAALLWGITEIEKKECEHEPVYMYSNTESVFYNNECRFCGVKLKAKWEKV